MAKSLRCYLMVLLMVAAGTWMMIGVAEGACEYLSQMTGGCPELNDCIDTCSTCDVGVGKIVAQCMEPNPGIGLLQWECRCYFTDGAPCPPPRKPGALPCPLPPSGPPSSLNLNRTVDPST